MQLTDQKLLILLTATTASGIPFSSVLPRTINLSSLTLPNIAPNVSITGTDPFSSLSTNQTAALTELKQSNTTGTDFCKALLSAQGSAGNSAGGKGSNSGVTALSFLSTLFSKRDETVTALPSYGQQESCGRCSEKKRRGLAGGPESENLNLNPDGSTFSDCEPSGSGGGESNVNINTPGSGYGGGSFGGSGGLGGAPDVLGDLDSYGPCTCAPIDGHAIAADAIDNALTDLGNSGSGSSGSVCKRDNVFGDLNLNIFNQVVAAYGDVNGTVLNGTNGYQINGVNVPQKLQSFQPTTLKNACKQLMDETNGAKNSTTTGGGQSQNGTQSALDAGIDTATEGEDGANQSMMKRFVAWMKN